MVFSKSEEEHVTHVSTALSRLRANNLFAKASKCLFPVSSVEYLGYVVSSEGLKMEQEKVQKILNWPPPRNLKVLQSFVGFANFYHRFIKNYSKKISSLTSLLKKDSRFALNEEALRQFHQLKEAFTIAPILSHFDPALPTIVETDASDYALGAVLSQLSDSGKHPIAFDSRKLPPAELNYEIHDKELLAIVWALKRWRAFILSLSSSLSQPRRLTLLHGCCGNSNLGPSWGQLATPYLLWPIGPLWCLMAIWPYPAIIGLLGQFPYHQPPGLYL
ncbi:hypothetical protein O181_116115 [Austropuccinia psidii MF-1]|uniref:Reverse transcriptase/retrotransposon-derived protein RNase H-like domain-containing protein n=1 Tax=Austropuccinia psidii MF-1 TaxID=1389203 RepID=A0A9Q3KBR7_9BASI|nr:hypothetical protein [Austropuccinia psidii MF-1]